MFKALLLVAGLAVSVNAYVGGATRQRIANNFEISNIQLEDVRMKYGMRQLELHDPRMDDKIVGDWSNVELWGHWFEAARGFAYGLQFSPQKAGQCYYAVDAALTSAETISNLMGQAYNPQVWADIFLVNNIYVQHFAAVTTYCNVQKLIKTLTTNPQTLYPAAVSRLGGGFILEIPNTYKKMKQSSTAFGVSRNFAKIFSLVCDYYI